MLLILLFFVIAVLGGIFMLFSYFCITKKKNVAALSAYNAAVRDLDEWEVGFCGLTKPDKIEASEQPLFCVGMFMFLGGIFVAFVLLIAVFIIQGTAEVDYVRLLAERNLLSEVLNDGSNLTSNAMVMDSTITRAIEVNRKIVNAQWLRSNLWLNWFGNAKIAGMSMISLG